MKLSLIIPCYNEAKNLPLLIKRCDNLFKNPEVEVILVNNGSTDESAAVLNELLPLSSSCKVVDVSVNQGYGFGILSGLRAASGNILGWTHADLQCDPEDALRGLALFDQYEPTIFVKGRRYGRKISDVFFTIGMSLFETVLLKKSLWDINAQPTLFSREFFLTWDTPPHDFSLDLYAYYKAKQASLHVLRFPVYFGKRLHGVSHWNINWQAKLKFIQRTVNFSLALKKKMD